MRALLTFVLVCTPVIQAYAQNETAQSSPGNSNSVRNSPQADLSGRDPHWIKIFGENCWMYDENPKTGEQVSWEGACANGLATGHGTAVWNNAVDHTQSIDEGTLVDGRFQGQLMQEGDSPGGVHIRWYVIVVNGVPNGNGTYEVKKNGKPLFQYKGNFVNGLRSGQGQAIYYNEDGTYKTTFNGVWENDRPSVANNVAAAEPDKSPTAQATSPPNSVPNSVAQPGVNRPATLDADARRLSAVEQQVLAALEDPEMRKDAEYLYTHQPDIDPHIPGTDQTGMNTMYSARLLDGAAHLPANYLNGPPGFIWLGWDLCHAAIVHFNEGLPGADTLLNLGTKWLKRAQPSGFAKAEAEGCVHDADEVRQEANEAAQKAAQEAAFQKKLPALLAERKKVGDRVCDTSGKSGGVVQVSGNNITVETRRRVLVGRRPADIGVTQMGQAMIPIYRDEPDDESMPYNQVYKCGD